MLIFRKLVAACTLGTLMAFVVIGLGFLLVSNLDERERIKMAK
jgi:hypothetical protein